MPTNTIRPHGPAAARMALACTVFLGALLASCAAPAKPGSAPAGDTTAVTPDATATAATQVIAGALGASAAAPTSVPAPTTAPAERDGNPDTSPSLRGYRYTFSL